MKTKLHTSHPSQGRKKFPFTNLKSAFFLAALAVSAISNVSKAQCNSVVYAVGSNNCGIDYISNVTFATINNSSACTPFAVFASTIPNVMLGQTYTLSVTTGGDVEGVRAWIDYNIDGTFANTPGTELVLGPSYAGTNPATYTAAVTIPLTATPGLTRLRARCNYAGAPSDPVAAQTWGETEDYCINIISGTPCSGTPANNTVVVTPTNAICPNSSAQAALANSYTLGGITYQWQMSNLSAVGPWTPVPNATLSSLSTPTLATPMYFSAIITCTNTNGSVQAVASQVLVQNTTTNNVYYFEGFEGIAGANKLPNCSWAASNLGNTCLTYTNVQNQNRSPRTGQRFASFYFSPSGSNYFWTNQIWMESGVTYSVNMWYKTEYYGYPNWQLNVLLNPAQQAAGSTTIASSGGPGTAASVSYKLLNNSFTVPTTGFYYVGINANSNASGNGYLSWDDLEIMVPCQLNPIPLTVSASSSSVCAGDLVSLIASGADTYLWSNGSTNAAISITPNVSMPYSVVGANAASGCTVAASQQIDVYPSPVVGAFAFDYEICAGKSTSLQALGANTYQWNNNANGALIPVTPNSTTTYTVNGTNAYGCSNAAAVTVTVHPLPVVSVVSSNANDLACPEDVTTLTGMGAVNFQWSSANSLLLGNPVNVSPNMSTTYSVTGADANGCEGITSYQLNVTECVGLNEITTTAGGVKLYPNPNQGEFVIEFQNTNANSVEVCDLTGRVLVQEQAKGTKITINLSDFANGVYYVKVNALDSAEVIKVVKN